MVTRLTSSNVSLFRASVINCQYFFLSTFVSIEKVFGCCSCMKIDMNCVCHENFLGRNIVFIWIDAMRASTMFKWQNCIVGCFYALLQPVEV